MKLIKIIFFSIIPVIAFAGDADLKKLKKTGSCNKCDFSDMDISGKFKNGKIINSKFDDIEFTNVSFNNVTFVNPKMKGGNTKLGCIRYTPVV